MELDLQCLFGLHVGSCTHWLRHRDPPPPSHLGSYTRVLLVRRHLFVTPSNKTTVKNCGTRLIHLSLPEASNLHLAFGKLIDLYETPCRKTSLGQGDG